MGNVTLTADGRLPLDDDLLRHLGVRPGDRLVAEKLPGGGLQLRAAPRTGKISDVFGALKREGGPALTIEQINEAAAEGWAKGGAP